MVRLAPVAITFAVSALLLGACAGDPGDSADVGAETPAAVAPLTAEEQLAAAVGVAVPVALTGVKLIGVIGLLTSLEYLHVGVEEQIPPRRFWQAMLDALHQIGAAVWSLESRALIVAVQMPGEKEIAVPVAGIE